MYRAGYPRVTHPSAAQLLFNIQYSMFLVSYLMMRVYFPFFKFLRQKVKSLSIPTIFYRILNVE